MVLSEQEIADKLTELENWREENGHLVKTYKFPAFMDGIRFVNRVAQLAEEANHHPDIKVQYTNITLSLRTHDLDGITEKDFDLARRIDS